MYLSTSQTKFQGKSAFTLIELLVVISIIALLVAMLLPVMSKAKALAQQTQCSSQERQLGLVFGVYVQDSKHMFPYANPAKTNPLTANSWSAATNWPWMMAINTYLGGYVTSTSATASGSPLAVFKCPSNPSLPFFSNTQMAPATSYGFNSTTTHLTGKALQPSWAVLPSNWHNSGGNPLTDVTVSNYTQSQYWVPAQSDDSLPFPSQTLFIGEIVNNASMSFSGSFIDNRAFNSANLPNFKPLITGNWDDLGEEYVGGGTGSGSARVQHSTGWNSLYADAHVSWTSRSQLGVYTQGTDTISKRFWYGLVP